MSDMYQAAMDFLADPFGGKGCLISEHPGKRNWVMLDDRGWPVASCSVHFIDPLIEQNKVEKNESAGKRWGDWTKIASVPLDLYFQQLNQRIKDGNDASLKRWLEDSDNRVFRTKEGRI
jgi:hypothetical protein